VTLLSLTQALTLASTTGAGWLILRAGVAKKKIRRRELDRCAACGRRRVGGRCPCSEV
jgi:hypothetical protein